MSIIIISLLLHPCFTSTNSRANERFNIDSIVNDVITRLHLDISDPRTYYEVYYSGRVLLFNASEISSLIGKDPMSIAFGYYDGKYWSTLPIRVFDRYIHTNVTNIYMMPKIINNNTKIMIKLPREYPVETNPWKNKPEFARGANVFKINLIRPSDRICVGTIYLFIGGYVRDGAGDLPLLGAYEYNDINNYFTASEPPKLMDYMEKLGYDDHLIAMVHGYVNTHPLELHHDIDWGIMQEPPVSDGGGSGGDYEGNVIEIRYQPTKQLMQEDMFLTDDSPSKTIKVRTIDPYVTDIDWRKILLTIVIARADKVDDSTRSLKVEIYNNDYNIYKHYILTIYSNKTNIITLAYSQLVYGLTCKYLYVKLTIISNMDEVEEWGFRIQSTLFLNWNEEPDDNLTDHYYLSIIGGEGDSEYSVLDLDIDNENQHTDRRIIFIQPDLGLAFYDIYTESTMVFRISISDSYTTLFPYKVTISLGGTFTGTQYIYSNNEVKNLKIDIEPRKLATLFSQYECIPVIIEVSSLAQTSDEDLIELRISNPILGEFTIRPLYTLEFGDNTILYSSTRNSDDDVWSQTVYGMKSRFHSVLAFTGDYTSDIIQSNFIVDIEKSIISQEVLANYELLFMNRRYDVTVDLGNGRTEHIYSQPADKVEITITFPEGIDLSDVDVVAKRFDLSGTLPELPEIPPIIPYFLERIPHPLPRALGEAIDRYNLIAWSWNQLARKSENRLHKWHDDRTVYVYWERGWFNNKGFNGEIKIVDVGLNNNIYELVTVDINIHYGIIGASYTIYFKT